jgi:hypothetical protein
VCEAVRKPEYHRARIEQTSEDEVNRELMSKYVATIEGYARERRRAIERVTVIDNHPRTLNSKFRIAGVAHYEAAGTPAEVLPGYEFENEIDMIPAGGMSIETPVKRYLKDRF